MDPTGMERWSSVTVARKGGTLCTIITAHRWTQNETGDNMVWSMEKIHLRTKYCCSNFRVTFGVDSESWYLFGYGSYQRTGTHPVDWVPSIHIPSIIIWSPGCMSECIHGGFRESPLSLTIYEQMILVGYVSLVLLLYMNGQRGLVHGFSLDYNLFRTTRLTRPFTSFFHWFGLSI
jgi:hypothetical protein